MKLLVILLPLLAVAYARSEALEDHDMAGHDMAGHNMTGHDMDGAEMVAKDTMKAEVPVETVVAEPVVPEAVNHTLQCYCQDLHGPMLECAYSHPDGDHWSCYKILNGEGMNQTVMRGYISRDKCQDDDWLDQKLAILNIHSEAYAPQMYCCHDDDLCNAGVTAAASWLLLPLAAGLLLTAA